MSENMELTQIASSDQQSMENTQRSPEIIVAEIRMYTTNALANLIEAGRRLCELKAAVPHGEFRKWVEASGHSKSSANNLMRLFEAYGDPQRSLFGAEVANIQAFGNLNYTKALALLALPSDAERVDFVETHDVENMTTRELKAAIRERDKAREERDAARKDEEAAKKTIAEVSNQAKKDRDERDSLLERVKELESRDAGAGAQPNQDAIDKAVAEAVEKANASHAAELDKLRKSEEKKRKALEKKVAEAEKTAKAAEEKADAAGKDADGEASALRAEAAKQKAEVERLRRELAMSGEATVTFKLYFAAWQRDYANMMDALAQADEDTAGRIKAAISAQIEGWTDKEI